MCPRLPTVIAWMLLCVAAIYAPANAAACIKSVRWGDNAPYAFKGPDGSAQGLHIHVVREALKRTGCTMRLLQMPWPRALLELQLGRLDLLPSAADTPERKSYAYFSKPTNSARTILFITTNAAKRYKITQLNDIVGTDLRISVPRDASLGDEYDALIKTPAFRSRLTYVNTRDSGWRMMQLNRVDGLIGDEIAGLIAMRQLGLTDIALRSAVVTSTESDYVAISKASNDAEFVRRFNAALDSMVADGTYLKILQNTLPCAINIEKLGCK